MAGVLPSRLLVHVALPIGYETANGVWVEGEQGAGPVAVQSAGFACVLFLPSPGGADANPYRPRVVSAPTLLCNPTRDIARHEAAPFPAIKADGSVITLGDEMELLVVAPELAQWTGGESVRWQLSGDPQPFGRPGTVMGLYATLRRVRD